MHDHKPLIVGSFYPHRNLPTYSFNKQTSPPLISVSVTEVSAKHQRPRGKITRRKKKINPYGVESWPDCGVSYGQVSGGLFLTF
jgi:hypothetical protein